MGTRCCELSAPLCALLMWPLFYFGAIPTYGVLPYAIIHSVETLFYTFCILPSSQQKKTYIHIGVGTGGGTGARAPQVSVCPIYVLYYKAIYYILCPPPPNQKVFPTPLIHTHIGHPFVGHR